MKCGSGIVVASLVVFAFIGVVGGAFAQTAAGTPAAGVQVAQAPGAGPGAAQRIEQMRQALRERLLTAGATEADVQVIMAFYQERTQILTPATQELRNLQQASTAEATPEQAKTALDKYYTAMKSAIEQLTKAEGALKAKLDLPNKPKLHAALLTMGVLDNGMPSMSGMGMMGGRFGGFGGPPGAGGGRGPGPGAPGA